MNALPLSVAIVALAAAGARAQDDVADVPAEKIAIGGDENQTYFLIGPAKDDMPEKGDAAAKGDNPAKGDSSSKPDARPAEGFGLVVIMPGGDGSAKFHPFVKRIFKHSLPKGYLVAQPVTPKWSENQRIVWPTARSPADERKFGTEEFVTKVIADVRRKHALNSDRVFTLSWSSSGPAAYAISLTPECGVTGSFVAMSVFRPDQLPPLEKAKGHAYFIYHSQDDQVCPFRMSEEARDKLRAAGAVVEFREYSGGHGWHGGMFADIREGIAWLEQNAKRLPGEGPTSKPSGGG